MGEIVLEGRLLQWGNSLGLRLTKAEAERAGFRAGQDVAVRIQSGPTKIDLSDLPTFRDNVSDVAERHDEYLGEYYQKRWEERQRAARRR